MATFAPIPLNLPPAPLQLTYSEDKVWVLDLLRKKKLICTPEEWVRQHWIHYLATNRNYPKSLMVTESGLQLNGLSKRSDLLIYNTKGLPVFLAEFKRPDVKIDQKVFDQIARYNSIYKISFLLVSNGIHHYYCQIDTEKKEFKFLKDLPDFDLLTHQI